MSFHTLGATIFASFAISVVAFAQPNGSAANPDNPAIGMLAWGTTVHAGAAAGSATASAA